MSNNDIPKDVLCGVLSSMIMQHYIKSLSKYGCSVKRVKPFRFLVDNNIIEIEKIIKRNVLGFERKKRVRYRVKLTDRGRVIRNLLLL